jgi:hypothetical protein
MIIKYVYQMAVKYTKWSQNTPNGQTICQRFQFQGCPKNKQIGILGMLRHKLSDKPKFEEYSIKMKHV